MKITYDNSSLEIFPYDSKSIFFGKIILQKDEDFLKLFEIILSRFKGYDIIGPVDVMYGVRSGVSSIYDNKNKSVDYLSKPYKNHTIFKRLQNFNIDKTWTSYISESTLASFHFKNEIVDQIKEYKYIKIESIEEIKKYIIPKGNEFWGEYIHSDTSKIVENLQSMIPKIYSDCSFIFFDALNDVIGYHITLIDYERKHIIVKQSVKKPGAYISFSIIWEYVLLNAKESYPDFYVILPTTRSEFLEYIKRYFFKFRFIHCDTYNTYRISN